MSRIESLRQQRYIAIDNYCKYQTDDNLNRVKYIEQKIADALDTVVDYIDVEYEFV